MNISIEKAAKIIQVGESNLDSVMPFIYDHLWKLEKELIDKHLQKQQLLDELLESYNNSLNANLISKKDLIRDYGFMLSAKTDEFSMFLDEFLIYINYPDYKSYVRSQKLNELNKTNKIKNN
jgi:hypothetical protein